MARRKREELIHGLFAEAADRVIKAEDSDPCTAICSVLLRKEEVKDGDLRIVLDAHRRGPWVVNTPAKLEIFSRWCEAAGVALQVSKETETINKVTVYRGDYGDCCLAEAVKGNSRAVWTRKGRLHVGFAKETDARAFRRSDPCFSMEATGNKRVGLVVIEGGDTPEMIYKATAKLRCESLRKSGKFFLSAF